MSDSVKILNSSNNENWKEPLGLYLAIVNIKLALREEETLAYTTEIIVALH